MRTGLFAKLLNILDQEINPATEEKQDDIIAAISSTPYNYVKKDNAGTYIYFGYSSSTGWQFKRKTVSTGVFQIASGLYSGTYADFDTAWTARVSITYAYA